MDMWSEVEAERHELADLLASLSPEQWDTPSLCEDWKVRHVVAHLSQSNYGLASVAAAMMSARFNLSRALSRMALRAGAADPETLLEHFRRDISRRKRAPGMKPVSVLADVVAHHQDIRRPLGLRRQIPEPRLRAVADYAKSVGFPLGVKARIAVDHRR